MKRITLFVLVFAIPFGLSQSRPEVSGNQHGQRPVTGEELEQLLAAAKESPDSMVAVQLDALEPAERLSAATIARCEKYLPGPKAKQVFISLVDRSMFHPPAMSEIPSVAEPDAVTQRKMLSLTADYVARTLHRMPNFYATRITTTFRSNTQSGAGMHPVGKHKTKIYYRDGDEVASSKKPWFTEAGLTTHGEFGPILATALLDAAKGHLAWSRWERGQAGLEAVYVYAVTAVESHYKVNFQPSAYSGEIAVDPSSGAVLRLVLKSELDPFHPPMYPGMEPDAADMAVEYGPVDLGGKTFICPLRGVAVYENNDRLWLNHVVFDEYHLFRGDMRILPGYNAVR